MLLQLWVELAQVVHQVVYWAEAEGVQEREQDLLQDGGGEEGAREGQRDALQDHSHGAQDAVDLEPISHLDSNSPLSGSRHDHSADFKNAGRIISG